MVGTTPYHPEVRWAGHQSLPDHQVVALDKVQPHKALEKDSPIKAFQLTTAEHLPPSRVCGEAIGGFGASDPARHSAISRRTASNSATP